MLGQLGPPIDTDHMNRVAATLAPVLSAPGRAPIAMPLHEKMQDPRFSSIMATWPEPLRRYAKRPQARRRGSQELSEQERWNCPLQCGKYYKTTSTRSIAKHKGNCPKLPVTTNAQKEQAAAERHRQTAAATAASLNPSAANALATAAAMGLLRIPPGSGPILPFPFPMLNPQLMLQILQQNPQAGASLAAAAAAAAQQQQQQQQQQQAAAQQQQQQQQQHQHQQLHLHHQLSSPEHGPQQSGHQEMPPDLPGSKEVHGDVGHDMEHYEEDEHGDDGGEDVHDGGGHDGGHEDDGGDGEHVDDQQQHHDDEHDEHH